MCSKCTHHTRTPEERFWSRVSFPTNSECWLWTGALMNGYGTFWLNGRNCYTHRWAYSQLRAAIPRNMTIDHLCRTRACVNPFHMEIVSMKLNTLRGCGPTAINARKTRCAKGHPYDTANTRFYKGTRYCHICKLTSGRLRQAKV